MLRSYPVSNFGCQALGSLLDTERKYKRVKDVNSRLYEKVKQDAQLIESLKGNLTSASSSYRKSKADSRKKHAKLMEYRRRLRDSNEAISILKRDLGENAIDRFMTSDEGYDQQREIFDRAVEEFRVMLSNTYPDFDFSMFNKEVDATLAAWVRPAHDPVEDLAAKFSEGALS